MMDRPKEAVLVTGASGSLGGETALTLAEHGFRVFAGTRNAARAEEMVRAATARRLSIDTIHLDVTDEASVETAVREVVARAGGLYGVVNIAGITLRGYFEDLADEDVRRVFEVNLFGAMRVTRHALPHLRRAQRGRIVMMSSIAGRIGSMALTAYVSSKFALEGFTESLALELMPLGIRVSLIEPGIVQTDIWEKNRHIAPLALDPSRPYHQWFVRAEEEANRLVRTATVRPADVAAATLRALTDRVPRLRYLLGIRARAAVSMRRHLPGETFERVYFGEVLRRVTGSRSPKARR
jgi:NAD(P)-dependent dehydrogenase (short-subunit alcohol dehydrogenase family)